MTFGKYDQQIFATSDDGISWSCKTTAKARMTNAKGLTLEIEEAEEPEEVLMRVTLERPEPSGVKLSRKNAALVTITPEEADDSALEKLIWYYLNEQKPTWGGQFLKAVELCPTLNV